MLVEVLLASGRKWLCRRRVWKSESGLFKVSQSVLLIVTIVPIRRWLADRLAKSKFRKKVSRDMK